MPSGERADAGSRSPAHRVGVVVPFSGGNRDGRLELAGLVPSGRALVLAFGLLLVGLGCWWLARESSLFAVRRVEVVGAPAQVSRQVKRTLASELGVSLVGLDADRVRSRVLELPTVRAATVDRAFPDTLRVAVAPERAVAVIRQRSHAWLVSGRGRVIASVERRALPRLPRIWVPRGTRIDLGAVVGGDALTVAAAAAALRATGLAARVSTARLRGDELTLSLRSGVEVRLGPPTDTVLKLRVAVRVLPLLGEADRYVDVSLPERPIVGQASTLR
jgi:cell division protein FtsQ